MPAIAILLSAFISSCGDNGISISDLKGEIQRGGKRPAQEVFSSDSGIVAMASNGKYVYAATQKGQIFAIKYPEKPALLANLGAVCSELDFQNLTVLPDGRLCAVRCEQARNSIVAIDAAGKLTELFSVTDHVLSLAANRSGKIFIGTWIQEGKISFDVNPYHLGSAEFVEGKLYEYDMETRKLTEISSGPFPVWICVAENNIAYVSLWGDRGQVQPDRGSHLWADNYHSFWLLYSEKIRIVELPNQEPVYKSLPSGFASFVMGAGALLGLGATKDGGPGFYLVEGSNRPLKLLFQDPSLDSKVSALTLHQGVVYFGTPDGKVLRIK